MWKNIPINKGNYSLETKEREQKFEKNKGEHWEKEYQKYRNSWSNYARNQYVSEWPLLVDIETSTICNLKCPMCYTNTDLFKSRVCPKLMDEELYYKIIDEIAGHVFAIRLSLRGEPTLHPKLIDFIKYAKKKGIKEVSFLTNGSKLNDEYIRQLIEAETDWITVSIDGIGDTYNNIRYPLVFEETYNKIKRFCELKKEYGVHRPVIKLQSVWPAIKEDLEEYYHMFEPISDLIAFNPLIDGLDNDTEIEYDENFVCPQLYQRIIIASDGKVLMCSNDEENLNVIGDMNNDTIYNIWNSEILNSIREVHKCPMGFMKIEVCRKCYLPRATEESERVYLDGREIVIKNYIGRSKIIGH